MPTYISKEGLEELKRELTQRKSEIRPKITEDIASAKELGDLSENFEYHDAKEQQGLNESRIMQLESMIIDSIIVEKKTGLDAITLGVTFTATLNGVDKVFSIVGSNEADPLSGKISNESPLGYAFMGKKVNEEVEIEVPSGAMKYTIKDIT